MAYLFSLSKHLAQKFHLGKEVFPNYTDAFLMPHHFTLFNDIQYTYTHTHAILISYVIIHGDLNTMPL